MAYDPTAWVNGETALSAANLNKLEQGVSEASDTADSALSAAGEPTSWGDVTGKPSSFPPEAHTHEVSEVNGLQDTLDALEARIEALEG